MNEEDIPDVIADSDFSDEEKRRLAQSVSDADPESILPEGRGRKMNTERLFKAKLVMPLLKAIGTTAALIIGWRLPLLVLALIGIGFGLFRSLYGRRAAESMFPSFGKQLNPYQYERFQNTVADLSTDIGVKTPTIYPFSIPVPNAAAVHSYADDPVMAVSKPLIKNNRESIVRSIIAHELGHIKHQSGKIHVLRSILSAAPVALPLLLLPSISLIATPLAVVSLFLLNVVSSALSASLRRREERVADDVAIETTSALTHAEALLSVAPYNPFARDRESASALLFGLFRGYPYMANRIERVLSKHEKDDIGSTTHDEPLTAADNAYGGTE